MAFMDDVAAIFVEAGLGVAGQTVLGGPRPKVDPSVASLTISPTGGSQPERTHNEGDLPAYVKPSAQIVARAQQPSAAEALAQAAWNALFKVRDRKVNGVWWRQTTMNQEPFPIEADEQGLARYVFNFSCVKRPSSATS
jgi:Bacteriophage minor capsid protein